MISFDYLMPTEVKFGWGIADQTGKLPQIAGKRCLFLSFQGFANEALLKVLQKSAARLMISTEFEENPGIALARRLAGTIRQHEFESIIVAGGGSSIDAAKAGAWLAANPDWQPDTPDSAGNPRQVALIALPTTAGTGSEVTPYAILTDDTSGLKKILYHPSLFPDVAVCDPSLTLSLPRNVTVNSGVDALSHAVEALLSERCQGFLTSLAFDACEMIKNHLPAVLADLENPAARAGMLAAATTAGIPLACCGTVIVHAIGYGLTHDFGYPHGYANGILLTAFVKRVADKGDSRAKRILNIFNGDLAGWIARCGIPQTLPAETISPEMFEKWIQMGMNAAGRTRCVVPLEVADVRRIVESVIR